MLLGLCVTHTDDIQEFPEMSHTAVILGSSQDTGIHREGILCPFSSRGQASYYVLRAGPGTSEYTKYKIRGLASQH